MPGDETQHKVASVLQGNETVLVVDDNEGLRLFLTDALPVFGYRVICAVDGLDGLNKFMENKDRVHVILLDIVMPKLNGLELYKEIKKLEPNTKVLFMSGYNDILTRTVQQDKIKYISKPFTINTLLEGMRKVLDKG